MASKNTSNQTCENENDNRWPRFLIMEAADENVPLNLNAFVLKKAIDGMANAELDNVKPMKSGRVFIEVETRQQCKNLLKTTKLLGYLPVKVSPHRTLNSSKFVIKCEELDKMEEDEIKKELQPQGIIAVKRISIRYSLYVLTIKGQTVPKRINIGYLKKETRPYIPNPQRCFQCQKFGHTTNSCKGKAVCAGCGEEGHNLDDCKNEPKCVNCQGDHVAISRDCPKWKIEKDIVTLKYTEKISFADARKRLQPSFDTSNTSLRQLDSIHNSGLRLALGAFCTSPVSSLYTEANEAPLEERRLKLSMHYYVKTRACTDNPAHHALHQFDRTTRALYAPRPNGRGGMTRPPAPPIGLKVEEAMTLAEINTELVCPLRTPNFPPGTHDYDPKRHDLIEGVSKCMISRQEAQAKFNEYREAKGSHDEVYTDGSKMNEKVGAAAVINRHFQNGETTCRQLSKRLPDNSTIFAAEATAISLALNYYQHMDPVYHDVVVYSDSMSCLQAIEGEDTENPFICHIMNLLWSLSDKGTRVRFCWVPSHCGIDGNERVDQLAKDALDQDIDPLASVHYTDMKPLVNSYIQKLVQTKWDVAVHGRDLYLVKPTLGPPKKFQHLTRAEEVVITRLRIGHTKATKSHILSRGLPTGCHHCGQTLTIDHMLLECALLQECRDEYYTVDSLNALFETIPETCIVEFLREAGFFYLIWCDLLTSNNPQTWAIWSDLSNCLENESNPEAHLPV